MRFEPTRRQFVWGGLLLTLLYGIWIAGPYLRSIVVRDAAVTTWLHVATSPIDGLVVETPLRIGDRIDRDGRIVSIANPRVDTTALATARASLDRAEARVAALTPLLSDLETLTRARARQAADYAENFRQNLDTKIDGMAEFLGASQRRLALERAEAERLSKLAPIGFETRSGLDAALARVASAEQATIDAQTGLNRATLHRKAAEGGLLFLDDGSDGLAVQRGFEDARLSRDRARADLAAAQRDADAARQVLDETQRLLDRQRAAAILGSPGGMVLSLSATRDAAVRAGEPIAAWVDCRVMLVDAPVSDVALSLVRPGGPASVVLEGERRARAGTVLLMRGSAATLGSADLAAVAKGRHAGVGQVIVGLEPTSEDLESCPIGRAAFVHFPDVNVLRVIRARLRW